MTAPKKPKKGAKKIKIKVLVIPGIIKILDPYLTIAAPIRAPIKACDEEIGSPKYQVIIFKTDAPITPANMVLEDIAAGSMIPLPMVAATAVVKTNAAMKLATAAIATA